MNRHRRVALPLLVCVLLTAGCLGFITGQQPYEFAANETVVGDAALDETGYQAAGNASIGDTINVSAAGQTRQVAVTSYLHTYNRSVDLADVNESAFDGGAENVGSVVANGSGNETLSGESGVNTSAAVQFTVLASPTQRVAGQSINPFARFSTEQLVRRFLGATNGTSALQSEGSRSVQSLGAQRRVSTLRTSDGDENAANDVLVHVTSFETGNDFVVVVGAHPAAIDERDRIDALIEGLEQPNA